MSLDSITKDMKDSINVQTTDRVESLNGDHTHVAGIRDDLIIADGEKDINKFVWYLSSIAGVSGFLYGWDTAVVGGALANIGDALGHNLNSVETEWAVASLSAGGILGTLIGGSLSDKIGRKAVLIIGDVFFILGGILICASFSLSQFIVGRILMGGGAGIATVVCAVYLGEVAPSMHRGRIVAVQSVMITGGQLCAYAVSAGLENIFNGWRILFALSLPFAMVQGIGMHWLPETPRFAVLAGNIANAQKTLRAIYPRATEDQLNKKLHAIQAATEVSVSLKATHPTFMGRLLAICTTPTYLRCITCAAVVFLGQQLSGWNSFLYYSSTLFGAAGFTNTSAVGILVAGINCIFTIISMFSMDRVGRRRMFLIGVPIMTVALAIAAVAFHYMTISTNGQLLDGQDYPQKWVGLMLGMMCFFIVGYAPSLGTIAYTTIELIPLEVRGIGSAIAVAFQWAGNLIISSTFLTMLKSMGAAGTYGLFSGLCFLTFIFIFFCYPESAGLTLEETGTLFIDGFEVKKADQIRKAKRSKNDLESAESSNMNNMTEL
ncbi:putative myo-inositol transporter [Meira miltonrushii]|uniref:Putative myo-inositol transporter n=1 Tax=Meira miltonrushii TaxID=1280837 RepID=A0A316VH46_9BASI|nr:putative myo-inositol transporter [Meira miltonrushii]PWN36977.1 putative myo-inositol transporter [Meira miltonrushii]